MKLSAAVLTENEATEIEDCLKSLRFCGEIIVVDNNSTDNTRELATKNGAKVFIRDLQDDFSQQRNFALSQCTGDWVLFVDADERVPHKLREQILKSIKNKLVSGYRLKRRDNFYGRGLIHGETARVRLIRLAKRKSGSWQRPVHEVWKITGMIGSLSQPLIHHPHRSINSFLKDINKYTGIEAGFRPNKKYLLFELISYPLVKFVKNYFIHLGFLEGFPGFIMAYMMSLHSLILRVKMIPRRAE